MEQGMEALQIEDAEGVFSSGLIWLLAPYAVRALAVLVLSTMAGALLYRACRRRSAIRAISNAAAASLLVLAGGWIVEGVPSLALPLLPVVFLGLPGSLWRVSRSREPREAFKSSPRGPPLRFPRPSSSVRGADWPVTAGFVSSRAGRVQPSLVMAWQAGPTGALIPCSFSGGAATRPRVNLGACVQQRPLNIGTGRPLSQTCWLRNSRP